MRKYLPHIIEGTILFLAIASLAFLGGWFYLRVIGQA